MVKKPVIYYIIYDCYTQQASQVRLDMFVAMANSYDFPI